MMKMNKELENIMHKIDKISINYKDKKGVNNKKIYNYISDSLYDLNMIIHRFKWTEEEEEILSKFGLYVNETQVNDVVEDLDLVKEDDGSYRFITWAGMGWKTIKTCKTFDEVQELIRTKHFKNFDSSKHGTTIYLYK